MSFNRQTVTLPSTAGETVRVDIKGFAVVVESINLYTEPEQVPLMYFGHEATRAQPLYPQSKYVSQERFKRLLFEATEESAGHEILILCTDACLEPDINVTLNVDSGRLATFGDQQTEEISGTDIFSFTAPAIQDADGNLPKAVYIGALDFDIRYSHNVNPDSDYGFVLTAESDPIKIEGANLVQNMRFSNETTGGAADGTLTYFFEY